MEYTLTFTLPSGGLGRVAFYEQASDAVAMARALEGSGQFTDVKLTRTSDEEMKF